MTHKSNPEKTAVLLLAHGSPAVADEIPEFLVQVTNGRHLPPHVVEEVKRRYELIGASPLTRRTLEQGELLAGELGMPVYVGMRNWKPYIADAVRKMQADGVQHTIAICLAPQNSRTSTGLYRSALTQNNPQFTIDFVESWHDQPFLIRAFAERLHAGLQSAETEHGGKLPVIFTAHSVPQRTITDGDPYETQAKETAGLVATEAGLNAGDWTFAFQSQGMSGGPWIGPTVEDTILKIKAQGYNGVFIQPSGFLCDHVEILYDIDIGFKQFAEQHQMKLWRAQSLNDSPLLARALAEVARSRIRQAV
ncbi:MAG TPA: ferrochelatase [Terriglobales bacterium]